LSEKNSRVSVCVNFRIYHYQWKIDNYFNIQWQVSKLTIWKTKEYLWILNSTTFLYCSKFFPYFKNPWYGQIRFTYESVIGTVVFALNWYEPFPSVWKEIAIDDMQFGFLISVYSGFRLIGYSICQGKAIGLAEYSNSRPSYFQSHLTVVVDFTHQSVFLGMSRVSYWESISILQRIILSVY
jgi:hypothetical protein